MNPPADSPHLAYVRGRTPAGDPDAPPSSQPGRSVRPAGGSDPDPKAPYPGLVRGDLAAPALSVFPAPPDERVIVFAPTGRDSQLVCDVLHQERLGTLRVADVPELCREFDAGVGVAVLAEEALTDAAITCLNDVLARQPAWSDVPLVLLTGGGMTTRASARIARLLQPRVNVTMLERPVRILTLMTAVQSSLRARRRQLEVRDLLREKDADLRHRADEVRRRDHFLAMLGHELRNPLATVHNALELLDDPESGDENRSIIARQTNHLSRLVDDLLDVSRVTTGKIVLRKQPLDLVVLVRRACEAVMPSCRRARQTLRFHAHVASLVVEGDQVRLEQIVTNLINNACKYSPPGSEIDVTTAASPARDNAIVSVRDNGVGIASDLLPKVFDLFVQADNSLHRTKGGLGIGLTVVRSLVEMHGGTVAAESDGAGHGSTFTVRLPARPDLRAGTEDRPESAPGSRRVLLVEDNPDARRVLGRLLERWGHVVETAADGPSGLETAERFKPEVALLDVGLPGMDGYELAAHLRASLGSKVTLVAITGYGQPDDRRRALEAGCDLHLVKPVAPHVLARLLSELIPGSPPPRPDL